MSPDGGNASRNWINFILAILYHVKRTGYSQIDYLITQLSAQGSPKRIIVNELKPKLLRNFGKS